MPDVTATCEKMKQMHQAATSLPYESQCAPATDKAEKDSDLEKNTKEVLTDQAKDMAKERTIKYALKRIGKASLGPVIEAAGRATGDSAMDHINLCAIGIDYISLKYYGREAHAYEGVQKAVDKGWESLPVIKDKLVESGPVIWDGLSRLPSAIKKGFTKK